MNPQNGEVLAMAQYPNYDSSNPRDLSAYYTQEQIDAMSDDEKLDALNGLWQNYCLTETYERHLRQNRLPWRRDLKPVR
ncbi:MAG: hypothetical protein V8S31_07815 [Lachnospiraceae bacterium]